MENSWKNNNMILNEASINYASNDDRVAVYVGTYGKYNNSSLEGQWMYPADYDSLEDFIDACKELHKDEPDAELMFQDVENLPDKLYSESGFSEDAFDYAMYIDLNPKMAGPAEAYVSLFGGWDEQRFEEAYFGEFDSYADLAQYLIDDMGFEGITHPENYFDFEHFGHELKWDLSEDEENDKYYLDMDDAEAGEAWINDVYGSIENMVQVDPKTIETYFDYEAYGRDVEYDFYDENGYYFWNN